MKVRIFSLTIIILFILIFSQQGSIAQTIDRSTRLRSIMDLDLSSQPVGSEIHTYEGNEIYFGDKFGGGMLINAIDHTYAHLSIPYDLWNPKFETLVTYHSGSTTWSYGGAIGAYMNEENWFVYSIGEFDQNDFRQMRFHYMIDGTYYIPEMRMEGKFENLHLRVDLSIYGEINLEYSYDNYTYYTFISTNEIPSPNGIDYSYATEFFGVGIAMIGKGLPLAANIAEVQQSGREPMDTVEILLDTSLWGSQRFSYIRIDGFPLAETTERITQTKEVYYPFSIVYMVIFSSVIYSLRRKYLISK